MFDAYDESSMLAWLVTSLHVDGFETCYSSLEQASEIRDGALQYGSTFTIVPIVIDSLGIGISLN